MKFIRYLLNQIEHHWVISFILAILLSIYIAAWVEQRHFRLLEEQQLQHQKIEIINWQQFKLLNQCKLTVKEDDRIIISYYSNDGNRTEYIKPRFIYKCNDNVTYIKNYE